MMRGLRFVLMAALLCGAVAWIGTHAHQDRQRIYPRLDLLPGGYASLEAWNPDDRLRLDDDLVLTHVEGRPRMRCRDLVADVPLVRVLSGCVLRRPRAVGVHWILGVQGGQGVLVRVVARGPMDHPAGLAPRVEATYATPAQAVYRGMGAAPPGRFASEEGLLLLDGRVGHLEFVPVDPTTLEPLFDERRVVARYPARPRAPNTCLRLTTRQPTSARSALGEWLDTQGWVLAESIDLDTAPARDDAYWLIAWRDSPRGRALSWIATTTLRYVRESAELRPAPALVPCVGDERIVIPGNRPRSGSHEILMDEGPGTHAERIDVPSPPQSLPGARGHFVSLSRSLPRGARVRLDHVWTDGDERRLEGRWAAVVRRPARLDLEPTVFPTQLILNHETLTPTTQIAQREPDGTQRSIPFDWLAQPGSLVIDQRALKVVPGEPLVLILSSPGAPEETSRLELATVRRGTR